MLVSNPLLNVCNFQGTPVCIMFKFCYISTHAYIHTMPALHVLGVPAAGSLQLQACMLPVRGGVLVVVLLFPCWCSPMPLLIVVDCLCWALWLYVLCCFVLFCWLFVCLLSLASFCCCSSKVMYFLIIHHECQLCAGH